MAEYQLIFHAEGDGTTRDTAFNLLFGADLRLYGVLAYSNQMSEMYFKAGTGIYWLGKVGLEAKWAIDRIYGGSEYSEEELLQYFLKGYGLGACQKKQERPWWMFWR